MNIILGIIGMPVGVAFVAKTEVLLNTFGRIEFFEKHLGGEGGSRMGYKLIGLLLIFIGILAITNLFGSFMGWLVSPLTQYSQPAPTPTQ